MRSLWGLVYPVRQVLVAKLGFAVNVNTLVNPSPALESTDASTLTCPSSGTPAPLHLLALRSGVVTAVRGAVLTTPRTCIVIRRPVRSSPPVISASGGLNLGVCDSLSLDASGSVDLAGRPLAFTWSIQGLNAPATASLAVTTDVTAFVQPAAPARLEVPQTSLTPLAM